MKAHEEKNVKTTTPQDDKGAAVPAYLLDRSSQNNAKVLSNMIKQKRKEKAGKWTVPLPKVRGIAEDEMFKVLKTGKRQSASLLLLLVCCAAAAVRAPCCFSRGSLTQVQWGLEQPSNGSAW